VDYLLSVIGFSDRKISTRFLNVKGEQIRYIFKKKIRNRYQTGAEEDAWANHRRQQVVEENRAAAAPHYRRLSE